MTDTAARRLRHRWSVAPTLRHYEAGWLRPDVIAGVTLAAVAIPEQMATARLANLPAVTGLYALVAGSVVFALLGCNRTMSVGADSTIAPIFAAGVASVAAVGTPAYAHLVTFVALMVGVLLIAVGLLRLGWISGFLSSPVVTGLLAGIAVEIFVRQLPAVLGVPGGGTTTVGRMVQVAGQVGQANGWTIGIAVGVLASVLAAERIDRRIPGALIGLAASTVVVATFGLRGDGVRVLGSISGDLPHLGVPSVRLTDVRRLTGTTLTVAFLCVVQTAATARASGDEPEPAGGFDQDLVALGAGSVVAGLSGAFSLNASPPRTAVVDRIGGRSQVTGLVAAAIVVLALMVATGLLKDVPQATLGAILVFVATRLFRVGQLRAVLRFDRFEFALALVTLGAVAIVGMEQGVLVAVVLALAQRTRLAARPRDAVLGREPGTDHWIPTDVGTSTEQVPGVLVYLLYAPVWFGNADYVCQRLRRSIDTAEGPVHAFVLDANGISDIDYTGAAALRSFAAELGRQGVTIGVARSSHLVQHDLKHSGLAATIGRERLFTSVEEAVAVLAPGA
jgi:SulP family sulfate permease